VADQPVDSVPGDLAKTIRVAGLNQLGKFLGTRSFVTVADEIDVIRLRLGMTELGQPSAALSKSGSHQRGLIARSTPNICPTEIWAALEISRQGAMDLLQPLLEAGIVEKIGDKKTGRYTLRKP
jgi:predicted HTH transcriptional regulator